MAKSQHRFRLCWLFTFMRMPTSTMPDYENSKGVSNLHSYETKIIPMQAAQDRTNKLTMATD
jgi:hypothetical protein